MSTGSYTALSSTKLELGDPWRYCCPSCGASFGGRIYRRVGSPNGGNQRGECDDREAPLRCRGCGQTMYELYDKKDECTVRLPPVDTTA